MRSPKFAKPLKKNWNTDTLTVQEDTIIPKLAHKPGNRIFLLLLGLYVLMFLPFWKPVILGFLFASACGPLERSLRLRLKTSTRTPVAYGFLAGMGTTMVILLAVIGVQIYSLIFQAFENTENLTAWAQRLSGMRDGLWRWLESQNVLSSADWHVQIDKILDSTVLGARDWLLSAGRDFVTGTPQILLNLFVFILAFSAFLLMGARVFVSTATVLGVEGDHEEQFERFEKICSFSLGSVLLIGIMQASLISVGSLICSEGNYFLIFALTFMCSMIPLAGAGLVPVVFLLYALVQGDSFTTVVMAITAGVSGVADNLLKAWLFSKASKTNPVISMISLLGGVGLLGFVGLFIAPTIEQLVMSEFHRRRDLLPKT